MADLRIVDAPEIPTENITGQEKLPTGGSGNYSITLDSVADYTKTKKDLADNTSVDGKVNGVRQELETHIEDLLNPHQVTKGQIGLGNVDNTADADKPVSNSTQAAIISAVAPKADKTYVDNQLTLKANKSETYTKQESSDLVNNSISTALTPVNSSLDLAKRGVANRYDSSLTYNSGERVVLANGDIVKSTIDGNTNDPNTDMTGWVKTNSASQIFDESGKTQQEINNLWNLFVNAKNDGSQDVSEIFTNYCNALNDGDTVVVPKGEYFWDSTKGTRVITKNINIECRGVFKVKPSANQMLIFSGGDGSVTVPMTTSTSLNKGADRLNISSISGITKPQEHFVSMQSSEELSKRTGVGLESSIYTKNLTMDIVSNAFRLRDLLPFGWNDLSLGTLEFIKKKPHVTVRGLRIEPTELGVFNAISTNRASNITFEDLEILGNKSNAYMVRIDLSYNIRFKQTTTTDASASAGYYAIMNNQSSYIYLDGVGYIDDTVSNRGYAGRHGFMCFFNECLLNGIDDHWGYGYYVGNSSLVGSVTVAGGDVTIDNSTSMQTLVRQRTDTPYNDGKLTIRNSWGLWGLLAITGHTTGGLFYTPYKAWDYVDIDVGLYDDASNNGIISIAEPYQDIEASLVFKETVMHVRNAVIQNNANGKKLISTSKQRTNNSGSGVEVDWFDGTFESKRLFSKIIVDTTTTINNSTATTINTLFTFPCTKVLELRNVDDFGFDVLRANELIIDNLVVKENRFASPRIDVGEFHANRLRTKENHVGYTWKKTYFPTPSSYASSSRLYSRTYVGRVFGDTIKSAVGMTYEIASLNNDAALTYKSRNNYVANTVYSRTFPSATVVAANGITQEYFVSAPNNDVGNIVIGSFANGGDGLLVNAYRTGHGHIKFKVKNLTEAEITIPEGSVIYFVIY